MKNTRSSGIVKKVSTKELRGIAIAKEQARQWLAKKERKVKKDISKKTPKHLCLKKALFQRAIIL